MGHGAHSHKKIGKIAPAVLPKDAKTCFVFFSVTNTTRTFGHLSCTDFEHFWNKRRELMCAWVNRWKLSKFLRRGLQVPKSQKQLKMGTFEGVFVIAQMAQFRTMGIISGTSLHSSDVPFMSEFWWGTYGLGSITNKKQISAIAAVDVLQSHDALVNKPMWA